MIHTETNVFTFQRFKAYAYDSYDDDYYEDYDYDYPQRRNGGRRPARFRDSNEPNRKVNVQRKGGTIDRLCSGKGGECITDFTQ